MLLNSLQTMYQAIATYSMQMLRIDEASRKRRSEAVKTTTITIESGPMYSKEQIEAMLKKLCEDDPNGGRIVIR